MNQSAIKTAFDSYIENHHSFTSKQSIYHFLSSHQKDKDPILRLIAWLIELNVIMFEGVSVSVSSLVIQYKNIINSKLNDVQKPTNSLSTEEGELIIIDTERTIGWINDLGRQMKLEPSLFDNAMISAQRVLTTLSLCDSFYSYIQGFDRYISINFLLGLQVAAKLNIEEKQTFAEAMSFFISKYLLQVVNVNKYNKDYAFAMSHFGELDRMIEQARPEITQNLRLMNVSSLHFAMKWELLSFADEHNIKNILLIWDSIILNKSDYLKYILCLDLAHVKQVKINPDQFVIQTLQNYTNWDIDDILTSSIETLKSMNSLPYQFSLSNILPNLNNQKELLIFVMLILLIVLLLSLYLKRN